MDFYPKGRTGMEDVPDAIVHHILSQVSNARDIASFACVSKLWHESIPFIPSLYFPRNSFCTMSREIADASIHRMVSSAVRLEELIIYCSYPVTGLSSWLRLHSNTLRRLELRMDAEEKANFDALSCIGSAKSLEALKLWGVVMVKPPMWDRFDKLQHLEIIGARMKNDVVNNAIHACLNLKSLTLLACEGVSKLSVGLQYLEICRLDFLGPDDCSLCLSSPRIQVLEIQGFAWICVQLHCLRRLSISKNSGTIYNIDVGKLPDLDYMSLRGVQWSWSAISSILQCASAVKHLVMKIEFTGDVNGFEPFPQIDFVDFFNNHPKLQKFEIHGAMFAALGHKDNFKNLDSKFVIPCLQEVTITVRSAFNPEHKLSALKTLLMHSAKLLKMTIRISQMRNCSDEADCFFKEICKIQNMNGQIVQIE